MQKIKIATNGLQSGDWVKVYADTRLIYQGHGIGYSDILAILGYLDISTDFVELTDFELEQYDR